MKNSRFLIGACAISMLAGCATPTVVERSRVQDYQLTCKQLESEIQIAEDYRRKAEKEKGVTGKNVAAALFFWPAMFGNAANAKEATEAAEDRKRHLLDLYHEKKCDKELSNDNG